MDSKSLSSQLIVRVILIAITLFALSWFILKYDSFEIGLLLVIIAILQIGWLIIRVHRPFHSIQSFYEAMQNKDSSFKLPKTSNDKHLNNLHNVLNLMNNTMKDNKIRAEQQEKYLQFLIEHSSSGLMALNVDTLDVEIINETARKLLDVEYTINIKQLQHSQPDLYKTIQTLSAGEQTLVKLYTENEMLQVSLRATTINYRDKQIKLISLNNIGQELENNELESWQKLTGVLTHEIMNSIAPITSLSNSLMRFLKRNDLPKTGDQISPKDIENLINGLEVIQERGKGLTDFVTNYRKLIKIPKPVKTKIIIVNWLDNISILLSEKLKDNQVTFEIQNPNEIQEFFADENQITQVIINLINNAVEALDDIENKKIIMAINAFSKERVSLSVSDNGSGILTEIIEQIFIPFFTTKETGSGIGLSLARQIVRLHGGWITVKSNPGSGAVFMIIV
jgi:nitrogen fixation/metabolism regulation signal transduction histidine kinase